MGFMKTVSIYLLTFFFLLSGSLIGQEKVLTGKVMNEKGDPIPGITIKVKGTALGTFSKADGTFKLTVPKSATALVLTGVGWKAKEVTIGNQTEFKVQMIEDKVMMDEVVVTAIGLEREKKSIGYSIQEVSGTELSESKTTNMVNSLHGKVAGVQINNSAGVPGASSFIRIRGTSSIMGGNQPLFIIDGIPIDNSMDYSGNPDNGRNNLLDGVAYSNRAIDLNTDDIESISVLKGPAATALYGLRAANGAIVITTKKGRAVEGEKINVSYSISLGFDQVSKLPELQNKYIQGSFGSIAQPGTRSPNISWGALVDTLFWDGKPTRFDKNGKIVGASNAPEGAKKFVPYDNVADFFRTGSTLTNSLSMAGGADFGSFFASIANSKVNGIIPNSSFNRTNLRINGEARISSNFKASGSAQYINSGGTRIQQGSNVSGVMLGLLRTPISFDNSNGFGKDGADNPAAYMFLDKGTQRTYRGETGDALARYDNPFFTVNKNPFTDDVDRFIGYVELNYYATDWFDIKYRIGNDFYSDKRRQIFSLGNNQFLAGQVVDHTIFNSDINSDLILTFRTKITDDIGLQFLLGNNMYQNHYEYEYVQGDGLIVPDFYHISNTQSQLVRQGKSILRRIAYYGDLTLDFGGWLYLTGNLRNELSTTLPKDNNSFWYGSGNLSFIFTEAFKDLFEDSFLSMGKLRLNYAVVGKDAPMYSIFTQYTQGVYADGWTSGISFPFGGMVGYMYGDIMGNPELRPEKTSSWEIGFNLAFLDNRIGLDFTYYNSISEDQIFAVPVASSTGFWRQMKNAGKISNKGFEIALNATPLKFKDFQWDLTLNFSTNKNMVEELAPGVESIFLGGFQGSSIRVVAGKPYGSIFGFGWARDENGNIVINDDSVSEEHGFPVLDPNEKSFGTSDPDWLMGFRNSFSFYGFTLSFLIDIKQGGKLWNGTKGALYYFGTHKETENRNFKKVFSGYLGHFDEAQNKYVTSGPNNVEVTVDQMWLAYGNGNGFYGSNTEDFIEDASWVRLRELSLSYQLPKSIVEYLPFSDVVLTFTGYNLWLSTPYTGVDPETSLMGAHNAQGLDYFNMPGTKTYTFTLNVKF